jgi:signal transduction histidine kinase
LLNLVINARDAMPAGGRLQIKTGNVTLDADAAKAASAEPGDYVTVSVADTGTGMTPEVREMAFEPFFTTKPIGSGSGLGLSQIYGFVRQSHGHVTLESTLGEGTTVTIYLRRAEDSAA